MPAVVVPRPTASTGDVNAEFWGSGGPRASASHPEPKQPKYPDRGETGCQSGEFVLAIPSAESPEGPERPEDGIGTPRDPQNAQYAQGLNFDRWQRHRTLFRHLLGRTGSGKNRVPSYSPGQQVASTPISCVNGVLPDLHRSSIGRSRLHLDRLGAPSMGPGRRR